MIDLGSLGGVDGFTVGLNNRGQVVGGSSVASNPGACYLGGTTEFNNNPDCHPFLWDDGKLIDLKISTTGGSPANVVAINEAGEIVGGGAFPNAPFDAYLWRNGVATDLGNLGDCLSEGSSINSHGQIVGKTHLCDFTFSHAFLWEDGSIVDLDTLIPPESSLRLVWAIAINERGEIAGIGAPPGVPRGNIYTQGHAFLLIPCDEDHGDSECEDEGEGTGVARGETNQRPKD
jgi:probable HAF family extracellular repeat protein